MCNQSVYIHIRGPLFPRRGIVAILRRSCSPFVYLHAARRASTTRSRARWSNHKTHGCLLAVLTVVLRIARIERREMTRPMASQDFISVRPGRKQCSLLAATDRITSNGRQRPAWGSGWWHLVGCYAQTQHNQTHHFRFQSLPNQFCWYLMTHGARSPTCSLRISIARMMNVQIYAGFHMVPCKHGLWRSQ
jgi:hypothetical protein